MNQEIVSLLRQNTKEIIDFVASIDADKTHVAPTAEKWSIIQICDHLMSVDFGIYSLMTSEGSTPDPERKSLIEALEKKAIDRTTKVKAPPHLAPKGKTDTIEKFVTKYPSLRGKIISSIENKDMSLVCDVFPHFVFGHMTYEEWIRFIILHSNRHKLQMEEVLEGLRIS